MEKQIREKCDSSSSGEKLLIKFFGSLSHKLNLWWKSGNTPSYQSITRLQCSSSRLTHLPRTSIRALTQNFQESWIKCPFSVSLPAFASICVVAGSFPKEMNSSEPGFDSPIFPLPHFCFISGITSLLYIQRRPHINAICLFITIPYQSFRDDDRLTKAKACISEPTWGSCLRWHTGNGSQPLLAGWHQEWRF